VENSPKCRLNQYCLSVHSLSRAWVPSTLRVIPGRRARVQQEKQGRGKRWGAGDFLSWTLSWAAVAQAHWVPCKKPCSRHLSSGHGRGNCVVVHDSCLLPGEGILGKQPVTLLTASGQGKPPPRTERKPWGRKAKKAHGTEIDQWRVLQGLPTTVLCRKQAG
jgi:hypothetical protein